MSKQNESRLPLLSIPYGARVVEDGVEFRIFSRNATRVWLLLFNHADDTAPAQEIELSPEQNRFGDLWHIHVPSAKAGQYYVYRMDGPSGDAEGNAFDSAQWLLDPYALAIIGREKWGHHAGLVPGKQIKNGKGFPKGIILKEDDFDWSEDQRPCTPLNETVIYEASVRGYTMHASAGVREAGTYRGLIEKIPYLKELGITTLELLPAHEFNEMEYFQDNDKRKKMRNFWGYSTLAFFAPNARFAGANQMGEQVREFKEMVLAMHKAGIEVIMDVVFNHTAENGMGGQTYSFRGIDNPAYYMLEDDGKTYKNFTGCGNTVNCNHPVVRDFIVDCLRYWVMYMHVDGFRFDLATILTRGRNGHILENPPVVERIADDPVLRGVKIIAEAWDAAGAYQVGSFPNARWSEWNGRYRDDIREFWKGTPGMLSTFATRLCGSTDLYEKPGLSILKSINFITSHDGFTMADIVSYNDKHNLANCEDNRDGDNNNHSHNCGAEGPSKDPAILACRRRRIKNMMGTLLLSQGVPMILAGDEFGRTQQGNNNAYCQDNDISWVDWTFAAANKDLLDFTKQLIAFRRSHPALMRKDFFTSEAPEGKEPDIVWYGPGGVTPPDWAKGTALACRIDGRREHTRAADDASHLFLVFNNGTESQTFELPANADGKKWALAITSQDKAPVVSTGAKTTVLVDGSSLNVFTAE